MSARADHPGGRPATPRARRMPTHAQALFRRLFVINGLVFTVGTLILALSPATVSSPVLLTELPTDENRSAGGRRTNGA